MAPVYGYPPPAPLLGERGAVTPPLPDDHGIVAGHVHDGRRLDAAATAVDQQVDPAGESCWRSRRDPTRADPDPAGAASNSSCGSPSASRSASGHGVVRHPDANGLPLRILQAAGHFPGRLQDEGVGPRRVGTQQAIAPVLDVGIRGNLGQIPAHQGEVVVLARAAECAAAVRRTRDRRGASQRRSRNPWDKRSGHPAGVSRRTAGSGGAGDSRDGY